MENTAKKSRKTRINNITIDDNFEDHRNDKFFVKKLDDFNEFIEKVGMPPEYYESQAATYADALSSADSLMVVHEPQTEYGKKKEVEE